MKILRSAKAAHRWRSQESHRLCFVPTMGALHEGHLSLIQQAKKKAERVVVSIFVNPAQFGPKEDLQSYPRQEKRDLSLLRDLEVDAVFLPSSVREIYPFEDSAFRVSPPKALNQILEARFRPHFFEGVCTVVLKLFQILRPDQAVFGEKDYQQLIIIESMVRDLFLPIQIVRGKTLREPTGLAMSSRNQYLPSEDQKRASALYEVLKNSPSPSKARQSLRRKGFEVDYLEVWSDDLREKQKGNKGRWLAAASLNHVRLIDNVKRLR